jgi:hypothetical protein
MNAMEEDNVYEERLAAERAYVTLWSKPMEVEEERVLVKGPRDPGEMTTAQWRKVLARKGIPPRTDQHICHLIAKSKGGADHIDNYYVASGSLNMSLGNRNDSYLAEVAGLEQMKKAIAVSRATGYTGPGAEEMIARARAMRNRAG